MKVQIKKTQDGMNIRSFIASEIPGLSRRILIELKKRDTGILVNGEHVTVRYVLREGDVLSLDLEDRESSRAVPSAVMPQILYEDAELVAVNKPPCMPTHPSHGHLTDTLANSLAYYYQLQEKPFVFRVINRLDAVTGGVVVVAKNRLSAARLSAAMCEGQYDKRYLALVEGVVPWEHMEVCRNIKRAMPSIIERTVCDAEEGEAAITDFSVLHRMEGRTLLSCLPRTGRTHQIRVHLASLGYPIVGDFLYGTEIPSLKGAIALHCASMTFPHPTTGEQLTISAALSPAFASLLPIAVQAEWRLA